MKQTTNRKYKQSASYLKNDQENSTTENSGRKIALILFLALFLASSTLSAYFYKKYDSIKNSNKLGLDETNSTVAAVSKLIVLPNNENPALSTVADLSNLPENPIFAKAKNGDKILVYAQSKKAILYDPIQNKIVDVAPLN